MTLKIDIGPRQYELMEGWGELPAGFKWGLAAGVACDSQDNVHVFTRTEHPYMVFDKKGKMLDHWGNQVFGSPHGICITPEKDDVYLVDTVTHLVTKWDKNFRHQMSMGAHHKPSDTGYTKEIREPSDDPRVSGGGIPIINGVGKGGPPFHQPTDVSIAANGDIYVSDGYRNSRAHKFTADGTLVKSVGEPGNAQELRNTKDKPGFFHTPHGIWTHKDRVYVSDRENYRIQVYDLDLNFIEIWTDFQRPTKIYVDARTETMYVSELDDSFAIVNLDGTLIGRHASKRFSNDPGEFWGPHCIWTDSEESVYVAEVLGGQRLQKFARVK